MLNFNVMPLNVMFENSDSPSKNACSWDFVSYFGQFCYSWFINPMNTTSLVPSNSPVLNKLRLGSVGHAEFGRCPGFRTLRVGRQPTSLGLDRYHHENLLAILMVESIFITHHVYHHCEISVSPSVPFRFFLLQRQTMSCRTARVPPPQRVPAPSSLRKGEQPPAFRVGKRPQTVWGTGSIM